jgi:hypothetical protein
VIRIVQPPLDEARISISASLRNSGLSADGGVVEMLEQPGALAADRARARAARGSQNPCLPP